MNWSNRHLHLAYHCLRDSLVWHHSGGSGDAVIATVYYGGDTDTNAAICGALLGAVRGCEAVPQQWAESIAACRATPEPTVANRALDMLIKMFNLAEAWELRPPGKNPCRFVRHYKVEPQHQRFLTLEEFGRLGRVLEVAPAEQMASSPERWPSGCWC